MSPGPAQARAPQLGPPLWMLLGCPGFLPGPSSMPTARTVPPGTVETHGALHRAGQHTVETGQRPPGPRWGHTWHSEPAGPHRG